MWSANGGLKPGQAFDATKPLPFLAKVFEMGMVPKGRGIVPGCGRGYAVRALSKGGRSVLGVDVSKTACHAAKSFVPAQGETDGCGPCEYMHGSFFDLNSNDVGGQFDFAYDYTFFCALDPSMRMEWAATYARLLKTEGKLFTAVFPIGERSGGLPYAMTVDLIESLLSPHGFKKTFEKQLGENEAHENRYNGPMNTTFCVWSRS